MVVGHYTYMTFNAVLETSSYDALAVGAPQSSVEPLLPSRQVPGRPDREPPIPAGSTCRYYSDGSFLVRTHAYRLCFKNGLLTARDKLTDHR